MKGFEGAGGAAESDVPSNHKSGAGWCVRAGSERLTCWRDRAAAAPLAAATRCSPLTPERLQCLFIPARRHCIHGFGAGHRRCGEGANGAHGALVATTPWLRR